MILSQLLLYLQKEVNSDLEQTLNYFIHIHDYRLKKTMAYYNRTDSNWSGFMLHSKNNFDIFQFIHASF